MSCLLQLFVAEIIMGTFRSNYLHTKPSNFALVPSVENRCRKLCLEKLGHLSAYISHELELEADIFGKWMLVYNALSKYVVTFHIFTTSSFL